MKKSKLLIILFAIFLVFTFPRAIYHFKTYALLSHVSYPKLELRKIVELQKKYFTLHGKYSYDLKSLGYPDVNQTIVGFSKICVQKKDPTAQVIRSYQISNQPQRWSLNEECNKQMVIKDNAETELFLDDLFEEKIVCSDIEKGFEATAVINVCGRYGVYRISETGEIETIKPIVEPFSYSSFFTP
jgi:Tfp pilus assembly protein PilE